MSAVAAVVAAIELVDKYGPVLGAAVRGRELAAELIAFIRENREIEGLTPAQRARAYNVLALEPKDLKL